MTAPRTSETRLEFPYRRTLGPVVGTFLAGLREGRLLGIRGKDGRVLVPPLEYDPETAEALKTEMVEVGPEGTVQAWAWVDSPSAKHPLDRPFAFALVRPDGADTAMVHAVDAGSVQQMSTGMKVRARFRKESRGLVTDLEAWEPAHDVPTAEEPPGDMGSEMGGTGVKPSETKQENMVMEHLISLTYRERLVPNLNRFVDQLLGEQIIGHKCPSCARVYVPPKGYCPLCVVSTGPENEIAVSDRGTLTGFTIVTPVAYYGQEETEPFVHASVLLDGADTPLGWQDIVGIPHEQLRTGLRVRALWTPKTERNVEGISNRGWGGLGSVIKAFEATGEPDAAPDVYKDHIF